MSVYTSFRILQSAFNYTISLTPQGKFLRQLLHSLYVEKSKERQGWEKQINDKIKGNHRLHLGAHSSHYGIIGQEHSSQFQDEEMKNIRFCIRGMFSNGIKSSLITLGITFSVAQKSRKCRVFEVNKLINGSTSSHPAQGWDQADRCLGVKSKAFASREERRW